MSVIIGIDLGTTNSVAAHMTDVGPRLIPNVLGETLTPSVVGIDESGKLLVGRAAKELQVTQPERCASLFKRYMGTDWTVKLNGRIYTPEQLSSLVLRSLKDDATAHLKQPVERAVVTVPAYFNDHQRKATLNAGRIAGLDVVRILNEPTAASIAYGMHETTEEKILAVLDLGGGTFDVSVVEIFNGVLEVRASSGETTLGGEDFTRSLAARVLMGRGYAFERAELDHPRLVSRTIQQAEIAKCRLSRQDSTAIRVPSTKGEFSDDSPSVTVTRKDLEQWTEHILSRVDLPIRRALGDAGLKPADVNEVVLVGGATRMPMFVDRVIDMFQKTPHSRLNPDEVVALGAAVQGALVTRHQGLEDLVVTDVAPFTLGVETAHELGHEFRDGYFLPIINRNTTIPVSRVKRVATLSPNQTRVAVKIYQGESRRVKDNLLLGEFEVYNIPRGPAGRPVDIRFTYDLNGVLEVEATVVETNECFTHVVARHARGMNAAQIKEAVAKMAALKAHPRDELANRFLLRRAERVYQELPLDLRMILEQLLLGFETALELGEKEAIGMHREELAAFLDRSDPSSGEVPRDDDESG